MWEISLQDLCVCVIFFKNVEEAKDKIQIKKVLMLELITGAAYMIIKVYIIGSLSQ